MVTQQQEQQQQQQQQQQQEQKQEQQQEQHVSQQQQQQRRAEPAPWWRAMRNRQAQEQQARWWRGVRLPGSSWRQVAPAVWLVVWVAAAGEFVRGYSGGLFYGTEILSPTPKTRGGGGTTAAAMHWVKAEFSYDPGLRPCRAHARPWQKAPESALAGVKEILGPIVAAVLSGVVTRRLGRRATMVVGLLLMSAGQLLGSFKLPWNVLMVSSSLYTVGSVLLRQAALLEVVEAAPTPQRGRLSAIGASAVTAGYAMSALLVLCMNVFMQSDDDWNWGLRLSLLLGAWPALMLALVIPWMQDTPVSLLQRGRLDEARRALQAFRGEFADTRAEYEEAAKAVSEGKGRNQYRLLVERQARPGLLLALGSSVLAAVLYPGWFMGPSGELFGSWGIVRPKHVLVKYLLPELSDFTGVLVSAALIDRVGRRGLMAWSCAALVPLAALLAGLMARLNELRKRNAPAPAALEIGTLALVYLMHIAHGVGWYVTPVVFSAEVQPITTRSAALGMHMAAWHGAYRMLYHVMDRVDCGAQVAGIAACGGAAVVAGAFAWALVPETAGVPLDAIPGQRLWRHPVWCRFAPASAAAAADGGDLDLFRDDPHLASAPRRWPRAALGAAALPSPGGSRSSGVSRCRSSGTSAQPAAA